MWTSSGAHLSDAPGPPHAAATQELHKPRARRVNAARHQRTTEFHKVSALHRDRDFRP